MSFIFNKISQLRIFISTSLSLLLLSAHLSAAPIVGRYTCYAKTGTMLQTGSPVIVFCSSADYQILLYSNGTYQEKNFYKVIQEGTYTVVGDKLYLSNSSFVRTIEDRDGTSFLVHNYDTSYARYTITYRWVEGLADANASTGTGSGGVSDVDVTPSISDSAIADPQLTIEAGEDGRINPESSTDEATVRFTVSLTSEVEAKILNRNGGFVDGINFPVNAGETWELVWDGRDADRNPVASGAYSVVIRGAGLNIKKPLAVVK